MSRLDPIDSPAEQLRSRIDARQATIGVCGLGYVGLPLAAAAARAGFAVVGFDTSQARLDDLNRGVSGIGAVSDAELAGLMADGRFKAGSDFAGLSLCDAILICVPTPLNRHREPDLSFVEATAATIAAHVRSGQLVVLESTTYPGTTRAILKPVLEATGLRSGHDIFIAYSPEREDPGNRAWSTSSIPKIVAGDGELAGELAARLYGAWVGQVVPVSSLETAEAVKLTENVFRAVNIALVNELKTVYGAMDIDIWEVIDAAKTKPFGYMPFYPGPGLGGHCIPIDPFYLAWKAREHGLTTRFIELAGEINVAMPGLVVERLADALNRRFGKALSRSRVLVLGLAYKKNVADTRESPALRLMALLEERGASVGFHDPHVAAIPRIRDHPAYEGRRSRALTPDEIAAADAVLVATDHDDVDYALVLRHAPLIVDTRNVFGRLGLAGDTIVKA